jgi:hypothetical protein
MRLLEAELMRAYFYGFLLLSVGGCMSTPEFPKDSAVKPRMVVRAIECELFNARRGFKAHELDKWVASADLVLQVDQQATLIPAFTHTNFVSSSLTRTFDWGLKYDSTAQRIYNESVTFKLDKLNPKDCENSRSEFGLKEVMDMAFNSVDPDDEAVVLGTEEETGPASSGQEGKPPSNKKKAIRFAFDRYRAAPARTALRESGDNAKSKGAFGTSLQFVLTYNVNATGPTWTLSTFKGPGKLLTLQRADTHRLTISFAKSRSSKPADIDAAKDAATQNNFRLQLLPAIGNQFRGE